MDRDRWTGIGWFLFIPLVLLLFTQPPPFLPAGVALLLGLAIMLAHRHLAEPWVAARTAQRCLWTGRTLATGTPRFALDVRRAGKHWAFRTAAEGDRRRVLAFLRFAERFALLLRLGILLPLALFLVSSVSTEVCGASWFPDQRAWSLALFQGMIATTVLLAAFAHPLVPSGSPADPATFPLPVHNLALLGVRNTLVVFALVGAYWIWRSIERIAALLAP